LAIVLRAVRQHGLPMARATILCLLGTLIAGAGAPSLQTAVPALVPIGAALVLGMPAVRQLRPEDRRVALFSIAIAVSVVVATIISRVFV